MTQVSNTAISPDSASVVAARTARVLASFWSLPDVDARVLNGAATRVATQVPSKHTLLSARIKPYADRPAAFLKLLDSDAGFQKEFRGLLLARAARPDGTPVQVPAVLHTVESEHALVTELAPGARLSQLVRRRYLALPAWALQAASDLGRWFAAFHDTTREDASAEEFAEGHCQLIHRHIEAAKARGRLSCETTTTAHPLLDAIAARVAAGPMSFAWCHGDVSLNNTLLHGRTLYVIDFGKSCRHAPELDQLGFWNSLRREIGAQPFAARARDALWNAFLSGYQEATESPSNIGVRDLLHLEDMTHELANSPPPGPPDSLAAFRRRRLLQSLTDHLQAWLADRAPVYAVSDGIRA